LLSHVQSFRVISSPFIFIFHPLSSDVLPTCRSFQYSIPQCLKSQYCVFHFSLFL
jgi:hypothetical protein